LLFPIIGLFTWSYFLAPFSPQYGAWKYLYVATSVAVPLAILIFAKYVAEKVSSRSLFFMPLFTVLLIALFPPPFGNLQWAEKAVPSAEGWVSVVVRELKSAPQRPITCFNSIKDDDTLRYTAYLCSRMSFGLGGFDEGRHRVWTAANYCSVPPEQMKEEWPEQYQRNLSVVLFDGARTSSLVGCQAPSPELPTGIFSHLDWNLITKLSPSGKVVDIQPTKPVPVAG